MAPFLFPKLTNLFKNKGIIILLFLTLSFQSCSFFKKNKIPKEIGKYSFSWNILFKEGTSKNSRINLINDFRDSLKVYYKATYGTDLQLDKDTFYFCPCDTLLYNFDTQFIDGSGTSVTSPPPPPPGPAGKGDYFDALVISSNIEIGKMEEDSSGFTGIVQKLDNRNINPNAILAVIDTGLDTTKFESPIKNLLWQDPSGEPTMYNFLPNIKIEDVYKLIDDHKYLHGTTVTALALEALDPTTNYPKIMALKALDENKKGSVFSVSCAMSYAIKNKVTIINESLGYYGQPDSILFHYVDLCKTPGNRTIDLFVAAGNTDEVHDQTKFCNPYRINNELTKNRSFYPACFSMEKGFITTVTTLNKIKIEPAFYQNYSQHFVTLGVLNKSSQFCTEFKVAFRSGFNEGSSFATPVASGRMINCMIKNDLNPSAYMDDWKRNYLLQSAIKFTVGGNYIEYQEQ